MGSDTLVRAAEPSAISCSRTGRPRGRPQTRGSTLPSGRPEGAFVRLRGRVGQGDSMEDGRVGRRLRSGHGVGWVDSSGLVARRAVRAAVARSVEDARVARRLRSGTFMIGICQGKTEISRWRRCRRRLTSVPGAFPRERFGAMLFVAGGQTFICGVGPGDRARRLSCRLCPPAKKQGLRYPACAGTDSRRRLVRRSTPQQDRSHCSLIVWMSLPGYSLAGRSPALPASASPGKIVWLWPHRMDRSAMPQKTHNGPSPAQTAAAVSTGCGRSTGWWPRSAAQR